MAVEQLLLGLKYGATIANAVTKVPSHKRFINSLRKPKHVLIVGESGSGKSQFINVLQNLGGIVTTSTMNVRTVTIPLPNGRKIEFTDTPGQQTLKAERQHAINEIARKKYDGIINFVCYGYQATEDTNPSDVFVNGTFDVKESYLEGNRKLELKQVGEWLPNIDEKSSVEWVFTVINKADVWYDKKEEVIAYYNSTYLDELTCIKNFKKTPIIRYCCVITPFCKKPMTLTMGENEKVKMHLDLYEVLGDLLHISWK